MLAGWGFSPSAEALAGANTWWGFIDGTGSRDLFLPLHLLCPPPKVSPPLHEPYVQKVRGKLERTRDSEDIKRT